jgi:choline dehydrogenase
LNQPKSNYRGTSGKWQSTETSMNLKFTNIGPWINQSFTYDKWPFKVYQVLVFLLPIIEILLTLTRCQQFAKSMGYPLIPDANAPDAPCDGFFTLDSTVDENMQRMSTFDAFLPRKVVLEREKNLTICTGVIASRIEFSNKEPEPRAEKVLFQYSSGNLEKVFWAKVKREVIVCSGTVGSPQVLMLRFVIPCIFEALIYRQRARVDICGSIAVLGPARI